MNRKKKILSVFLALCVVVLSAVAAFSTFGATKPIELDKKVTGILDGSEDMNWYTFTPAASGTYSFLSYNVPASEAYLFIKQKDPDTGKKSYVQLEYSNSDANYEQNGHNRLQFCLTYYLQKGVTYYFAAGWREPETIDISTNMTVMLRCDEYYEKIVDSIELSCPAYLQAYVDGQWLQDPSGTYSYFYYNLQKIMANMTITVHFADGRTSTVTGKDTVEGYDIIFNHSQSQNHWYPQNAPEYTANTLTVRIADASADFDVPIRSSSMFAVSGKVVDTNGDPVSGVRIFNKDSGSTLATTDSNGNYYFATVTGSYNISVTGGDIVTRDVKMEVGAIAGGNDFSSYPIEVVRCDYVDDDVINAKDYAYIIRNFDSPQLDEIKEYYKTIINFSSGDYSAMSIKDNG